MALSLSVVPNPEILRGSPFLVAMSDQIVA